jgi:iron complex outermembrane receptor protein
MSTRLLPALAATTALMLPVLVLADRALAQPAGPSPDNQPPSYSLGANGLESVVVTARKRAENEQSVPISISAYSQADLDRLDIKTIEDLRYVSPSVYVAPTTFRQDTLNITIRGQRDFDSSSGQSVMSFDPAAAVYMDGVYMARPVGLTGGLFDIDSVEVLKGPQGTLVGRNSTGGAILYRTREPESTFGGYVNATLGDYGRAQLRGALNIPLNDTLFFRVAAQVSDQRGYIANYYYDPASGYRNNQPAMGANKIAANLSLKWQPDDSFNLILRANLAAEHDTGSTYHSLGWFDGHGLRFGRPAICNLPGACIGFTDLLGHKIAPYYSSYSAAGVGPVNTDPAAYNSLQQSVLREQKYGFWSTEQTVSNRDVGHYQTVSATANKDFGDIDVKWLTAYRWWDNRGTAIGRGLPYDTADYEYIVPDYKSYQSELTVNGNAFAGSVKWTAGLFFFQEDSPHDGGLFYLFIPNNGYPQPGKGITLQDGTPNSQRNTSYAGYAQATWSVRPDTRLTAGVRYTYDERFAYLGTRSEIFPATATSTASVPNGVFDPGSYVLNGITYNGITHACTLTDINGVLRPPSQCGSDINASFHKPTWTLAIDHDLWDGTMVYFTTRSGYRSGAINSTAINPAVTVAKPENVLDYEAGVKSDWTVWNMPVRTNLSAYYTDYHDIQILTALPNVTLATGPGGVACTQALYDAGSCDNTTNDNVTLNAKAARIYGTEWEISLIPLDGLMISANGSYLDAHYTDYTFTPPPGYLLPTGTTNLSGTPFPLPSWQTSETVTYATGVHEIASVPVDDVSFTAHYYWQSRTQADLRTFDPSQRTGSYGLLDIRANITGIGGSKFDFGVYMSNVLNTPVCMPEYNGVLNSAPNSTFGIAGTAGALQCVPLAPRMSGITLGYKF